MSAAPTQSEQNFQSNTSMPSPRDSRNILPRLDDISVPPSTPVFKQSPPSVSELANSPPKLEGSAKDETRAAITSSQHFALPSKPTQTNPSDTPDYFSGGHHNSHFSLEPNPFEQSFGNPSSETPGKFTGLPSVASLTSPAPLGPGGTPSWQNSLRSGPLSPAMLPGPTGGAGYFDEHFRGSFPTPNESSLRTGLTPGGGGSMFPAPSPNSQAIFNSMQSGGATPGTLDFHRTAMNAAARSKIETGSVGTQSMGSTNQAINKQDYQPAQQQQHGAHDTFSNHPESDAVNSLYMLAQTGTRGANQFAVPSQPLQSVTANAQQTHPHRSGSQTQSSSGNIQHVSKTSVGNHTGLGTGISELADYTGSDGSLEQKSSTRGRGKKAVAGKSAASANGRRKAEDTPTRTSANKKMKGNDGMVSNPNDNTLSMSQTGDESEDDGSAKEEMGDQSNSSGKKMTDEEKRKNFLERNRVAALKCRQRKKQWLANLQTKVEIFSSENDALSQQCTQLREEIVNLKTLLLAHKDCPVSHSQGLGGNAMAQVIGEFNPHANPYGIAMNGAQPMMGLQQQQQAMQRR